MFGGEPGDNSVSDTSAGCASLYGGLGDAKLDQIGEEFKTRFDEKLVPSTSVCEALGGRKLIDEFEIVIVVEFSTSDSVDTFPKCLALTNNMVNIGVPNEATAQMMKQDNAITNKMSLLILPIVFKKNVIESEISSLKLLPRRSYIF